MSIYTLTLLPPFRGGAGTAAERTVGRQLGLYLLAKRILDVVGAGLLLIPATPVIMVCALLIRLESSGRAIFIQQRTGLGGRRFRMHKLRTMVKNAEEVKAQMGHLNRQSGPDFKVTNDPRITPLGRFLRKSSLDELPQLWNVLRGDMSLVGPRPTSFPVTTYDIWHTARLSAKPGITGLWQISGRSNIDFDERCRLDIAYIRQRSFWLDLKILLRTLAAVSSGDGAE